MYDFKIVFTLFVLCFTIAKGLAEGWHLKGIVKSWRGTMNDRYRKSANDAGFFLFCTSMLIINMAASSTELRLIEFAAAIFWAGAIRYFIRDGFQNFITGKPWIYTGSVSTIEKIIGSTKMWANWVVKLLLLAIFGSIYFLVV